MRKQRAERLRFAVNTLPPETRRAMLDGVNEKRIVTGANSDRRGGLCPMLAADRDAFVVTPLAEIFATAWDKYTGTSFVNVTRRTACERDVAVLRSMLETSLALEPGAAMHSTAPAPQVRAQAAPAELVQASQACTVAARIEIARALAATGHTTHQPALPSRPRPSAAPTPGERPRPVIAAAGARGATAWAPAARAGTTGPATARTSAPAAAAPSRRMPSNRTSTELDRERARAVVANQAAALRPRAWPRPSAVAAASVQPVAAPPVPLPAAVPAPAQRIGGDQPRTPELVGSGWAWLRPLRSYDEYERQLQDLGEMSRPPHSDDARSDGGGHRSSGSDSKQPQPSHA